jgi:hypothetical protein
VNLEHSRNAKVDLTNGRDRRRGRRIRLGEGGHCLVPYYLDLGTGEFNGPMAGGVFRFESARNPCHLSRRATIPPSIQAQIS